MDDDHAFARDHIFADVFAVIAAAHFGDEEHLPQLAVDFHITHPDNVIGQKRNRVMTKRQRGKCILYFDRAQNRKPRSGQRPDQSVERLAKVLAITGHQGHLEAHQRINHQPFRADLFHGIEKLLHRFIHRKVDRTIVDDF